MLLVASARILFYRRVIISVPKEGVMYKLHVMLFKSLLDLQAISWKFVSSIKLSAY